MAEKEGSASSSSSSSRALSAPLRPTITLPPRTSMESLITGGPGASPGPMTLVSNFFSDVNDPDSECRSFSQLLAGAMASPAAFPGFKPNFPPPPQPPHVTQDYSANDNKSGDGRGNEGVEVDFCFKQSRPAGLVISQPPTMFTIPPGLSPASLLDSPGFFLPGQGPLGMSHQQALAQVTAQAQAQAQLNVEAEYPSLSAAASLQQLPSFTSSTATQQQMPHSAPNHNTMEESSEFSHSDQRTQPSSIPVDKLADDDYNWRKYGQKQVKGSEYPRSYYKCTHPNCPVKKKVERSPDGQVIEIIYRGQHNHQPPRSSKQTKDTGNLNGMLNLQGSSDLDSEGQTGNLGRSSEGMPHSLSMKNQESSQTQNEHDSGSSNSEEVGDGETVVDGKDEDEPESKRRKCRSMEVKVPEPAPLHRTVTEPRIIVQTTSEVDLLDDGYRWRKYGQKVVKGNAYPRSYYKCTSPGCNVRKHVERAASDPKAVITTYEGKHNHDVPAARNSSHNTANRAASQLPVHNAVADKQALIKITDYGNNEQQPIALLRFKEEKIT